MKEITQLALINRYLISKYKINEPDINAKILCEAQTKSLLVDIKGKQCHERLYIVCDHELIDINDSASWLTKGNINPRDEGVYCFLQDRVYYLDKEYNGHIT